MWYSPGVTDKAFVIEGLHKVIMGFGEVVHTNQNVVVLSKYGDGVAHLGEFGVRLEQPAIFDFALSRKFR